jgi:hypothetical protein
VIFTDDIPATVSSKLLRRELIDTPTMLRVGR